MKQVAIVTGGSSGIGLAAAKCLKDAGYSVYTVSRREFTLEGTTHIRADLTREEDVKKAVDAAVAAEGRVDVLINCAGLGIGGAVEFSPREEIEKQVSVAFLALDAVVRQVLPVMRRQGGGKIINISSMAALANLPFQAYYSAMKAAVNSYTLALRNEVGCYGIEVCAVLPGDIKTGFTAASRRLPLGDGEYGGRIGKAIAKMNSDEQSGPGPEFAGAFLCRLAQKKKFRCFYTMDFLSGLERVLFALLPVGLANRIVGKMYAQQG